MSVKKPLTLAGLEPATFRVVAQHLNHCGTVVSSVFGSFIYSWKEISEWYVKLSRKSPLPQFTLSLIYGPAPTSCKLRAHPEVLSKSVLI